MIKHKDIPIPISFKEDLWNQISECIDASGFVNDDLYDAKQKIKDYIECKYRVIHSKLGYGDFSDEGFQAYLRMISDSRKMLDEIEELKQKLKEYEQKEI